MEENEASGITAIWKILIQLYKPLNVMPIILLRLMIYKNHFGFEQKSTLSQKKRV